MSERPAEFGDVETEREVIGFLLAHPEDRLGLHAQLAPDDFFLPAHKDLWEHWTPTIDPHTLADKANLTPEEMADLFGRFGISTHQTLSAVRRVLDFAGRRRIVNLMAVLNHDVGAGADYVQLLEALKRGVGRLDLPLVVGEPDPDVAAFAAHAEQYDWAIPEFLERQDRLMVTAGEGQGKSTLLAQLAFMAAVGVHPWTWQSIHPLRVLYIDMENPERLVRRRLRSLMSCAPYDADLSRLRVVSKPEGINLIERTDRMWLLDRVAANETELLVIGPTYKLYSGVAERGDAGGEDQIRTVVGAIDEIRWRFNVTVIIEAHSPHGDTGGRRPLRPSGSSVWLRWPEFGFGLRQDAEKPTQWKLEQWRGPRDERVWPTALTRGVGWPWQPIMPDGTFRKPSRLDEPPAPPPPRDEDF